VWRLACILNDLFTGFPDPAKAIRALKSSRCQLRNFVYYNGEIGLLSRYPAYKTPLDGLDFI
jgi:hypothetical protein